MTDLIKEFEKVLEAEALLLKRKQERFAKVVAGDLDYWLTQDFNGHNDYDKILVIVKVGDTVMTKYGEETVAGFLRDDKGHVTVLQLVDHEDADLLFSLPACRFSYQFTDNYLRNP